MSTRDFIRRLKSRTKEQIGEYLDSYAKANYEKAIRDDDEAFFFALKNSFGFTDEDIARLVKDKENRLDDTGRKIVDAGDIQEGLVKENRVYDKFRL